MDKISLLAEKLAEKNISHVFGISGSGPSYQLIDALLGKGIKYIPVSHEACAAIAAGTHQYLSGKLSASVTIKGPGFVNALAGITGCWFERYPFISISEDYDDSAPSSRMHKRLDQLSMVRPVAAKIASLSQFDEIENFLTFNEGNEAPHHFQLCEMAIPERAYGGSKASSGSADLTGLISTIKNSKTPILIIGSLIKRLGLEEEVRKLKLPVFTTVQAKGIINEKLDNSAGIYTGAGAELAPEKVLTPASDLVISIGMRNHEILGVAEKAKFQNIDNSYFDDSPSTLVCSKEQIIELLSALQGLENWAKKEIGTSRDKLAEYRVDSAWMPAETFRMIDELSYDHGMVLDTGTFCTLGEHFWNASPSRPFVGSSNGRNMGIGVPTALGASLAYPETPFFCVLGDGGVRYYPSELKLFAEYNLPVCFILMTDGQFGSIACNIKSQANAATVLQPKGSSWLKAFEGMGIAGQIASNAAEFSKALEAWDRKSPYYIELPYDRETYKNIALKIR